MVGRQYLTARQVMDLFHISKNTLYSGPLRQLAVVVGKSRGLRWPLKRLIDWGLESDATPVDHAGPPKDKERAEVGGTPLVRARHDSVIGRE